MRRGLAVLGAVVMIIAAVLIRRGIDADGRDGAQADDKTVIVCAADLYCCRSATSGNNTSARTNSNPARC